MQDINLDSKEIKLCSNRLTQTPFDYFIRTGYSIQRKKLEVINNGIVSYPFSIQTTISLIPGVVCILSLNFKADNFNPLYFYIYIIFLAMKRSEK